MTPAEIVDYPSENSDSDEGSSNEGDDEDDAPIVSSSGRLPAVPPRKRRKLDVPARELRQRAQAARQLELHKALEDIEKQIKSRKAEFAAGRNSLQEYRARAIQSYLVMVVKRGRLTVEASERAAESQGFAAKWGGRNVRQWTRVWIKSRKLPASRKGCHAKVYSLLDDPAIKSELRTYLRSNKWAIDPSKLKDFTTGKLIPTAAEQYLNHVVREEMPRGLKKYMEIELFPRLQLKAGKKGISLTTARRWLHKEGFKYIGHKKGFWVFEDQHALRKKGVGRGLHRSDIICSTCGHIPEAGQQIEYGKNYDGYWTGELFVNQVERKILPSFEARHGPGFQALIMVDNSQGHSAYAEDALLATRMNVNPGGKQARMHDGWYIKDGRKIIQLMIFPSNHPTYPNQPKGMKHFHCELNFIEFFWGMVKKYLRDNCDYTFDTLKENMPKALASVKLATIRRWEHRMVRWMDAYRAGLETQDAQLQVRQFSSRTYKSHRRVAERVARAFDQ
ncbi:hypothetical protein DFH09DRAFT_948186 [Mycena vulgaris]|nr:hypothetical protein DFH09DRAFT_948186 [Mycena vulgaris]